MCAGGFGKEALDLAQQINEVNTEWEIKGFIDDGIKVGTEIFRGYKVIGGIKDWNVKDDEYFVLGVAKPQTKEILYNILKEKGAHFATLINPSVRIPEETVIGEGCVIVLGWIGMNVKLGKCVNVAGSMIGDSDIEDFSTTTGFANVAAAHIGKRVFIGSHAVILYGRKVGDDAVIGAGSIVISNVKPKITVFGNPAIEL